MTDDDCVNVQCLPAVVDLPVTSDNVKVIDVSCGSRHTAVVTGNVGYSYKFSRQLSFVHDNIQTHNIK